MPTENRSSNTEMAVVLAPFAAVADCYDTAEDDSIEPARDLGLHKDLVLTLGQFRAVRALLAQPAPQPHPEPIAWMVGTAFWWTKEEAERDAAEMNLPVIGLGPMTDTGETQRLREALKFYADRGHFAEDIGSDWDNVSGEPANVLWHEQEAWFVEDGSIARAALLRKSEQDQG